jgi:hypothetical protein
VPRTVAFMNRKGCVGKTSDPAAAIAAVIDESGVVSPRDLVRPTPFPTST